MVAAASDGKGSGDGHSGVCINVSAFAYWH